MQSYFENSAIDAVENEVCIISRPFPLQTTENSSKCEHNSFYSTAGKNIVKFFEWYTEFRANGNNQFWNKLIGSGWIMLITFIFIIVSVFLLLELIARFVQRVIINTLKTRHIVYNNQLIFLMRCGLTFIHGVDW